MNLERLNRITVEEGKCGGRPCIRGLRIRVKDVLELLSAGASFEEILNTTEDNGNFRILFRSAFRCMKPI